MERARSVVLLDGAAVRNDDRVGHAAAVLHTEAGGRQRGVAVGRAVTVLARQVGAAARTKCWTG